MIARQRILLMAGAFLLGILGGLVLGLVYGKNSADAQLAQKLADTEKRFATVNDSYLVLVREYNKLFASRPAAAAPTTPKPAPTATLPKPAAAATAAPSSMTATPAATVPPSAAGPAKPKADFKGEAINGTAPLEGPPPQPFKFTDLSAGDITSWKWSFGDGTVSADKNPDHTYGACPGEMGLCTVALTVCGPGGCDTMIKDNYVRVSESCRGC